MAIRKFSSFQNFETNAFDDLDIIRKYFGCSFEYQPYAEVIFSTILTQKSAHDPDDILDHGGYWTVPVTIRHGLSLFKILDYLIMPEILTEFVMRLHTISYKEAIAQLYANNLPTTHHIDTLV